MPAIRKRRLSSRSQVKRKTQVSTQKRRGYLYTTCDWCGKKTPSATARMRNHNVVCPACAKRGY